MFLSFPLDYQLLDFIKAAVAPFGRLITWIEGPNKSRVLVKCLLLSPNRVVRSISVSQGSLVGGMGRSWSVPVFILNGHFPDDFPPEEDPVPFDGNPHPAHDLVHNANSNAPQDWQHDLHGAANAVHNDFGLNADQMADIQNDLLENDDAGVNLNNDWDPWPEENQADNAAQLADLIDEDQQQESISFDQSGSSAHYLRAHGPDITLTVEDVLVGKFRDSGSSSSSSEASSSEMSAQMVQPSNFYQLEALAFQKLLLSLPATLLQLPIILERVDLSALSASSISESLATENSAFDVNPLAIVPYQPSLHAVLISLWASAQDDGPTPSDKVHVVVDL